MNNTFSISRFAKVVKSEILTNKKNILSSLVVPVFLVTLEFLAGFISQSSYTPDVFSSNLFFIGLSVLILTFVIYKNLFHKVNGVYYSMLPAKNIEKFLSMLFITLILLPLLLSLILFILSSFSNLIFGFGVENAFKCIFTSSQNTSSGNIISGFVESPFWSFISIQAIAIWGVCFFRNNKTRNTFLSLILVAFIITISIFFYFGINRFNLDFILSQEQTQFWKTVLFYFEIIFPVGMLSWAYYKFTRQQV
ncbi:MAG: hypothetical protein LBQ22_09265 [Bacteroidales bacterium]|jgi:hypothetical protein|nr:hypothetical protein [Bacteroidales bacterium]